MRLDCVQIIFVLIICSCFYFKDSGCSNGLAKQPPMGWNSWILLGCNVNCTSKPNQCVSEKNIRAMADSLVSGGFRDAGYELLQIDDCWLAPSRDSTGRQVPDPERFPSGIKKLADYIHSKGLKFGIYTDIGVRTCAGYPGSEFYLELDAQTYAEWGVDYIKVDGCSADKNHLKDAFEAFGLFLNRTGRPIVYACEWPAYMLAQLKKPDYKSVQRTCNVWRTFADMGVSWRQVELVISFWALNIFDFGNFSGPGSWSDPDVLVIGNGALSNDQELLQMTMWAMFSAPLLMSADLRRIPQNSRAILTHPNLLKINQDPAGEMAVMVKAIGSLLLWRKRLHEHDSFALATLNMSPDQSKTSTFCIKDFGLDPNRNVTIFDVVNDRTICSSCQCFRYNLRPTSSLLVTV